MRFWLFSSSINSFFKVHTQPSNGVRCLIFGRTLYLLPYFMCANSEGSDESARMCRLAWAFAGRLCGKYHNLMTWLKYLLRFVYQAWLYRAGSCSDKPHCSDAFSGLTWQTWKHFIFVIVFKLEENLVFKTLENLETCKKCLNYPKLWTMWLSHRVRQPTDADWMANNVDPDQTAPEGTVWSA